MSGSRRAHSKICLILNSLFEWVSLHDNLEISFRKAVNQKATLFNVGVSCSFQIRCVPLQVMSLEVAILVQDESQLGTTLWTNNAFAELPPCKGPSKRRAPTKERSSGAAPRRWDNRISAISLSGLRRRSPLLVQCLGVTQVQVISFPVFTLLRLRVTLVHLLWALGSIGSFYLISCR